MFKKIILISVLQISTSLCLSVTAQKTTSISLQYHQLLFTGRNIVLAYEKQNKHNAYQIGLKYHINDPVQDAYKYINAFQRNLSSPNFLHTLGATAEWRYIFFPEKKINIHVGANMQYTRSRIREIYDTYDFMTGQPIYLEMCTAPFNILATNLATGVDVKINKKMKFGASIGLSTNLFGKMDEFYGGELRFNGNFYDYQFEPVYACRLSYIIKEEKKKKKDIKKKTKS